RGQDLVDDLLAAVEARGIPLAVGNAARALITDAGAVIGAEVETQNGERHRVTARKTILAVNGFAANRDLVARFCPEISGAQYFGARGSTGEAVLWGEELGAALGNIGAYQGYAAVSDPHGSLLSWTTIEKGGFIVNGAGRRFGDESAGYSGYTPNVMAQGGPCFAIFDQRIFDVTAAEEEFVELANYGGVKRADTITALAALQRLDDAAVGAAFADYNKAARGEMPDAFGRRDFALAPLRAPLYICRVVPGLFHTQGGLMVDLDGRVLRPNGQPIANLFAGGGAAAGLSGRAGASGYASGNGLLSAIGLGRLAGFAAAREVAKEAA
ncbi:MAG: FAD-binding protein, partial [Alphaproteobacteria bacterium]|nr:FAD-binding protein [Alphaproteobacteria bacterium]